MERWFTGCQAWTSGNSRCVLTKKGIAMSCVTEGFGSAGFSDRKGAGEIGIFEAIFDLRPPDELMNEASVETVSRSNQIDRVDHRRKSGVLFLARPRNRPLRPPLYDKH